MMRKPQQKRQNKRIVFPQINNINANAFSTFIGTSPAAGNAIVGAVARKGPEGALEAKHRPQRWEVLGRWKAVLALHIVNAQRQGPEADTSFV